MNRDAWQFTFAAPRRGTRNGSQSTTIQLLSRILLWAVLVALTVANASSTVCGNDQHKNSVGMTMKLMEAGRFEMGENYIGPGFHKDHTEFNGGDDDRPVHPVVLTRPYYLATTEVTIAQFRQFVEATKYVTSAERDSHGAVGWDPASPPDRPRYVGTFRQGVEFHWKNPGFEQRDNHPVVGVSFNDAKAYCAWLTEKEGVTYRLPTEAEWEYAARAGTQSYFSFGNAYRGQIQRFANIGNVELEKAFPDRVRRQWLVDVERDPADNHVFTSPVGSYESNPWGLFDLYGNVWEWCEDRYLDTAYTAFDRPGYQQVRKRAIDPLNEKKWGGDDGGDWRVIRGGSWFNAPVQCRSSVRGYFEAGDGACYLGFRVVHEAPATVVAEARRKFDQSEAARQAVEKLVGPYQERRDGRLALRLRSDQLGDELFAALKNLDEPLDIQVYGLSRLSAAHITALAQAPKLMGLQLSDIGSGPTDEDFAVLAKHPKLELLEISGAPQLTDAILEHLRGLTVLEWLHLDGKSITDNGLRTLPVLPRLKVLLLANTASQGLVLDHFSQSPLERFSCRNLTDEGARRLGALVTLFDVSLGGSPITGRGLTEIAKLRRLDSLDLTGCSALADDDFVVLGDLYGLRTLHLSQTAAGDGAVTGLTRLNNLRTLTMGSKQMTDLGTRRLCEVVSLENLTIISDAVELTDAAFTDLWRLVNLRNLDVSAPGIAGTGFTALHELPKLEWLHLGGSGLTDLALENAARSRSLKNLQVGDRRSSGPVELTDRGVLALADAPGLTRLELIRRGTKVTDDGIAKLRERRPQLTMEAR